jgi:hypothetical protein
MNTFLLKDLTTNKEQICSKATVDGFDYYYIDELIPYKPGGTDGYFICLEDHNLKNKSKQNKYSDYEVKLEYISPFEKNVGSCGGCRKLIATNNPDSPLPKLQVKYDLTADNIIDNHLNLVNGDVYSNRRAVKEAMLMYGVVVNGGEYQIQSGETDLIEFGKFCINFNRDNKDILRKNPDITVEGIFEVYKQKKQTNL